MYGLILADEQNYGEAEIFLQTVTDFYPRFVEGWVILHLFYIRTDYTPGIDKTLFQFCVRNKYESITFRSLRDRSRYAHSGKLYAR